MCGIAGGINIKGFDIKDLVKMTDIISHRGPDDEGFFFAKENNTDVEIFGGDITPKLSLNSKLEYFPTNHHNEISRYTKIGLGHRRLSIIDLSTAGHQPMCSVNKNIWIVFNGEIYNYLTIKSELQLLGYNFVSNTDTEVVMTAYQEWGIDCQNKFIGMFAFAIYDREKEIVLLSRDRYGIKPLYYWISPNGTLYFGSEIKQFSVLCGWDPRLNHERASDFLYYNGLTDHTEETLFSGVYQVLPGTFTSVNITQSIFVSGEKLNITRWYKEIIVKKDDTFSISMNTFKTKLEHSVQMHLISDVKIGSALSGGLDSSSIVCLVKNVLTKNGNNELLNTFSSINEDDNYSEKYWISEVLKHLDCNSHYIIPTPNEMLCDLEHLIWHMDEPYHSQSAYLGYRVFKKAKDEKTLVVLNGQGADEYIGGYGSFLKIFFAKMPYKKLFKLIKKTNSNLKIHRIFKIVLKHKLEYIYLILPSQIKSKIVRLKSDYLIINKLIDRNILKNAGKYPFKCNESQFLTHIDISKFQLFHDALPRYLRWEDRNSMANSVEARVPFLDHTLVEYCHSIPLENLVSEDSPKHILKESMKGILPELVRQRKDKKGFLTPEERWVKKDFTNEFRALLNQSIKYSNGIIKSEALQYFDKVANDKLPFTHIYWRLIVFGFWMKVFNVKI